MIDWPIFSCNTTTINARNTFTSCQAMQEKKMIRALLVSPIFPFYFWRKTLILIWSWEVWKQKKNMLILGTLCFPIWGQPIQYLVKIKSTMESNPRPAMRSITTLEHCIQFLIPSAKQWTIFKIAKNCTKRATISTELSYQLSTTTSLSAITRWQGSIRKVEKIKIYKHIGKMLENTTKRV